MDAMKERLFMNLDCLGDLNGIVGIKEIENDILSATLCGGKASIRSIHNAIKKLDELACCDDKVVIIQDDLREVKRRLKLRCYDE